MANEYKYGRNCRNCNERHNDSLCLKNLIDKSPEREKPVEEVESNIETTNAAFNQNSFSYLSVVEAMEIGKRIDKKVNCLLDTGIHRSLFVRMFRKHWICHALREKVLIKQHLVISIQNLLYVQSFNVN